MTGRKFLAREVRLIHRPPKPHEWHDAFVVPHGGGQLLLCSSDAPVVLDTQGRGIWRGEDLLGRIVGAHSCGQYTYLITNVAEVCKLRSSDGKQLTAVNIWESLTRCRMKNILYPGIVERGFLWLTVGDDVLVRVELDTLEPTVVHSGRQYVSHPFVWDGKVTVISDGRVVAFSATAAERVVDYRLPLSSQPVNVGYVAVEGNVAAFAGLSDSFAVDLRSRRVTTLKKLTIWNNRPVLKDGVLVGVGDIDKTAAFGERNRPDAIHGVDISTGKVLWRHYRWPRGRGSIFTQYRGQLIGVETLGEKGRVPNLVFRALKTGEVLRRVPLGQVKEELTLSCLTPPLVDNNDVYICTDDGYVVRVIGEWQEQ